MCDRCRCGLQGLTAWNMQPDSGPFYSYTLDEVRSYTLHAQPVI